MKKIVKLSLVLVVFSVALMDTSLESKADLPLVCFTSHTGIGGVSTQDAQVTSYSYRTNIICDKVEYEWVLDLGTSGEQNYTTTTQNFTMSPLAFQLGGNPLCGSHTISVRTKVDNGVDPIFYTAYFTKSVTVINCI